MKMYVELNESKYNATFESNVYEHPTNYGNGKGMTITRNGELWKILDCRYYVGFEEEKVLRETLQDYFGKNLVNITIIK